MLIRAILSILPIVSVAWSYPNLESRGGPQIYGACIKPDDIAMTFDDGPYIYLRNISDQFTAAGAKATFFMNGNNWGCIYAPDRIASVKYVYSKGHMIGSHTWSHPDLRTFPTAQIQDEMYRMEEAFSRIVGVIPAFMRPPSGYYNDNVKSVAFSRGQSLALWDRDTGDADGNTTAQSKAVYNAVVNSKAKNALILQHETEASTAGTLVPYALELFRSKGYNMVSLAECIGVNPYQAVGVAQQQTLDAYSLRGRATARQLLVKVADAETWNGSLIVKLLRYYPS
ncbi:carbohydrate esterase family 4 protein [Mycena sanguinolenta]|nr:carbohydrate esterase family 4 protein [Mycena sanguinolenta]